LCIIWDVQVVDVVNKEEVVKPKDAELENINARHTKNAPNVIVAVVAKPAEDAVNLGINKFFSL